MKKTCFFTIADSNNLKYYEMLKASLKKFHPDIPLILIGDKEIAKYKDPMFFYRATPIVARELLKTYETVIKIDADSIVTGKLDEAIDGVFDVGVVNNSNPIEMVKYPVTVWDIHVNCGFVVMKNKAFVDHWLNLCMGYHFNGYQMREQDLLNIIVFYGNYDVKFLDQGDSYWGLASKGFWQNIKLIGKDLVLPKAQWPDKDKIIRIIHWAGGNTDPQKMNYRLYFQRDVQERLRELVTSMDSPTAKKEEKRG
jgi:hypothetical protein